MNLASNLESSAFYYRDRPVFIEENKEISYLELNQESNRVARALIKLGVRTGDHVALCAPNSWQRVELPRNSTGEIMKRELKGQNREQAERRGEKGCT